MVGATTFSKQTHPVQAELAFKALRLIFRDWLKNRKNYAEGKSRDSKFMYMGNLVLMSHPRVLEYMEDVCEGEEDYKNKYQEAMLSLLADN